jgi:DNA-binding transcriptional ArsR family regulator
MSLGLAAVTPDDFAWEVLADVSEEAQMLYEPLATLRASLPDTPEAERQRIVERTLRALYGAGLIVLVRGGQPPTAALADPARHLGDDVVDSLIAGSGWRTVPVGSDGTEVWVSATDAGRRALAEAPPEITARRGSL